MNFPGLCTWITAASLSFSAWAANWPEWRGPTRDGVTTEKNLPISWDTSDIKWKAALPDRGNSTPIIWGNKVFISQAVETEGKRLLICFNKQTGEKLWEAGPTFGQKEDSHATNPQSSPSPATDGTHVVAWHGSAGLFCYDFDGKELWKRDFGKQTHEWGYASSPVIHKDLVYLYFGPGPRTFLVALEKNSGKTVWQIDYEEKHPEKREDGFAGRKGVIGSWSTPILVQAAGREELVLSIPEFVVGYHPVTGKELWRCRGMNPLVYTSPVYGEGVIVVMGGFHGPDLAVKPGGNGDVTETHKLWQSGRTENRLGSAVIRDGLCFVMTMPGLVECIDLKTGEKIWKERARGRGAKSDSWSSMVLSEDKIYVLNQSSETIVLRASREFQILSINSLEGELTNSSLAVSDGEFFIRTHEHLYCISKKTKTALR
jgi:outer membrane protein assembly factor BamB